MNRASLLALPTLYTIIIGCGSIKKVDDKTMIQDAIVSGIYSYEKNSTKNHNRQFYEAIELKEDLTFHYKARIGGFVKVEIGGDWRREGNRIILNDRNRNDDRIKTSACPKENGNYLFNVLDQNGNAFNYSLKVGSADSIHWIRELYGPTQLDSYSNGTIKTIQVITSLGLHSKVFELIDKNSMCYTLRVEKQRHFENEVWIYEKNKLNPKRLDGQEANYYLYKNSM